MPDDDGSLTPEEWRELYERIDREFAAGPFVPVEQVIAEAERMLRERRKDDEDEQ